MVNLAVDLFNLGMLFSPVDNSGAGSVTTVKLCNVIPALHFGLQTKLAFEPGTNYTLANFEAIDRVKYTIIL